MAAATPRLFVFFLALGLKSVRCGPRDGALPRQLSQTFQQQVPTLLFSIPENGTTIQLHIQPESWAKPDVRSTVVVIIILKDASLSHS